MSVAGKGIPLKSYASGTLIETTAPFWVSQQFY